MSPHAYHHFRYIHTLKRLAILNLDTLELRRLRFDLAFYYKVLNHLTPFNLNLAFTVYTSPSCLRANLPFFLQRPGNSSCRILSDVFYRSIPAWNSLPIDLRLEASFPSFKRNLRTTDLTIFLKGAANIQYFLVLLWMRFILCI
jgi:hypothetical protein